MLLYIHVNQRSMTVKHTDSIRKADIPVDRLSDEGKCLLAAEEEANAISTYLNMAENSDGALKESFEEVADDEAEHLGKVLSAVSSIRPELLEGMMNGVQESEDEGFDIDGAVMDRINAKTEKPGEVDFDREIESAIRKSLGQSERSHLTEDEVAEILSDLMAWLISRYGEEETDGFKKAASPGETSWGSVMTELPSEKRKRHEMGQLYPDEIKDDLKKRSEKKIKELEEKKEKRMKEKAVLDSVSEKAKEESRKKQETLKSRADRIYVARKGIKQNKDESYGDYQKRLFGELAKNKEIMADFKKWQGEVTERVAKIFTELDKENVAFVDDDQRERTIKAVINKVKKEIIKEIDRYLIFLGITPEKRSNLNNNYRELEGITTPPSEYAAEPPLHDPLITPTKGIPYPGTTHVEKIPLYLYEEKLKEYETDPRVPKAKKVLAEMSPFVFGKYDRFGFNGLAEEHDLPSIRQQYQSVDDLWNKNAVKLLKQIRGKGINTIDKIEGIIKKDPEIHADEVIEGPIIRCVYRLYQLDCAEDYLLKGQTLTQSFSKWLANGGHMQSLTNTQYYKGVSEEDSLGYKDVKSLMSAISRTNAGKKVAYNLEQYSQGGDAFRNYIREIEIDSRDIGYKNPDIRAKEAESEKESEAKRKEIEAMSPEDLKKYYLEQAKKMYGDDYKSYDPNDTNISTEQGKPWTADTDVSSPPDFRPKMDDKEYSPWSEEDLKLLYTYPPPEQRVYSKEEMDEQTEKIREKKFNIAEEVQSVINKEVTRLKKLFKENPVHAWSEIGVELNEDTFKDPSDRHFLTRVFEDYATDYVWKKSKEVGSKIKKLAKKYNMHPKDIMAITIGTDTVHPHNPVKLVSGYDEYSDTEENVAGLKMADSRNTREFGRTKTPEKLMGESDMNYLRRLTAAKLLDDEAYYPGFKAQVDYNHLNFNIEKYGSIEALAVAIWEYLNNEDFDESKHTLDNRSKNIAINLMSMYGGLFNSNGPLKYVPSVPNVLGNDNPRLDKIYSIFIRDIIKGVGIGGGLWDIYAGDAKPVSKKEYEADPFKGDVWETGFMRNAIYTFADALSRGVFKFKKAVKTDDGAVNYSPLNDEEKETIARISENAKNGALTLGGLGYLILSGLCIVKTDDSGKEHHTPVSKYVVDLINENNPYIDVLYNKKDKRGIFEIDSEEFVEDVAIKILDHEDDVKFPPALKDWKLRDNQLVMGEQLYKMAKDKKISNEKTPFEYIFDVAKNTEDGFLSAERVKAKKHDFFEIYGLKDKLEHMRKALLVNEIIVNGKSDRGTTYLQEIRDLAREGMKFKDISIPLDQELKLKRRAHSVKYRDDPRFEKLRGYFEFKKKEEKILREITKSVLKKASDEKSTPITSALKVINDMLNYISAFEVHPDGTVTRAGYIINFGDRRSIASSDENEKQSSKARKGELDITIFGKRVPLHNLINTGFLSNLSRMYDAVVANLPQLVHGGEIDSDISDMINTEYQKTRETEMINTSNKDRKRGYVPILHQEMTDPDKYEYRYTEGPVNEGNTLHLDAYLDDILDKYPYTRALKDLISDLYPQSLRVNGEEGNPTIGDEWLRRLRFSHKKIDYEKFWPAARYLNHYMRLTTSTGTDEKTGEKIYGNAVGAEMYKILEEFTNFAQGLIDDNPEISKNPLFRAKNDFEDYHDYQDYLAKVPKFVYDAKAFLSKIDDVGKKTVTIPPDLVAMIEDIFEPKYETVNNFKEIGDEIIDAGILTEDSLYGMLYEPTESFLETIRYVRDGIKSSNEYLGKVPDSVVSDGTMADKMKKLREYIAESGERLTDYVGGEGEEGGHFSPDFTADDLLVNMMAEELSKDYNADVLGFFHKIIEDGSIKALAENKKSYSILKPLVKALEKAYPNDFKAHLEAVENSDGKKDIFDVPAPMQIPDEAVRGDIFVTDENPVPNSLDAASNFISKYVPHILSGRILNDAPDQSDEPGVKYKTDLLNAADAYFKLTGGYEIPQDDLEKLGAVVANKTNVTDPKDGDGESDIFVRLGGALNDGSEFLNGLTDEDGIPDSAEQQKWIKNKGQELAEKDFGTQNTVDQLIEPFKNSVSHMKEIAKSRIIDSTVEQTPIHTTSSHPIWQPTDYVMPLGDPRNHQIGDEISVKRDQPDGTKTEVWDIDEEIRKRQK